ncbi:hypothetical protein PVLB_11175 [Pseudomonas sp. VLB120]|nr:hypothetical protein PVLB_11175 [Pseudomonas sp. VLB120]
MEIMNVLVAQLPEWSIKDMGKKVKQLREAWSNIISSRTMAWTVLPTGRVPLVRVIQGDKSTPMRQLDISIALIPVAL